MRAVLTNASLWCCACFVAALCGFAKNVDAQAWGINVLANSGGELGPASASGQTSVAVPNWNTAGSLTVVSYGAPGVFPATTDGVVNPGNQFFAGGPTSVVSQAIQWVDLSAFSEGISEGGARFEIFASLGGYAAEDDTARLIVVWLDAAGQSLRTDTLLGPTAFERDNQTKLLPRRSEGILPSGTTSMRVILLMTRVNGTYNNAYADDLRVTLYPGPCSDMDFNNDEILPDDQDITWFFEVLAGATCEQCDTVDFNDDSIFPTDQDIIDLLNVLAGGRCGE
jgi:hypothetical protein